MAGAVANAHEERTVGLLRQRERFRAPQLPCRGVVHVRANIRALGLIATVFERNRTWRRGSHSGGGGAATQVNGRWKRAEAGCLVADLRQSIAD